VCDLGRISGSESWVDQRWYPGFGTPFWIGRSGQHRNASLAGMPLVRRSSAMILQAREFGDVNLGQREQDVGWRDRKRGVGTRRAGQGGKAG
jgi:hypothetical protein